jgi:hypothetical protein
LVSSHSLKRASAKEPHLARATPPERVKIGRRSGVKFERRLTITFSQYVVMWLSGYYNGKRNNTIIEPDAVKKNEQKVNLYCYQHREVAVMDAVTNVLGFDK